MHVAVRSYLSAGVALVGAGAIVAAPITITPSPPDIQVPAIHASAVQLAAMANPIEQWLEVLGSAFANVAGIGEAVLADPAPVLRQILLNQLGYAETLVTGLQGTTEAFVSWATTDLPTTLQQMAADISQGDIAGAAEALNSLINSLISAASPLFSVVAIPGQIAQNLTNAINAITGSATLAQVIIGVLGPVEGIISAMGDSGQALVDAIGAGDPIAALTAIINIPAVLTGALLNGYTSVAGDEFVGLLTFNEANPYAAGLVQTLFVTIPQAIAAAITPASTTAVEASTSLAATDIASVPDANALTVSVDTPSTAEAVEAQPAVEAETEATAAVDVTADTEATAAVDVTADTEETDASSVTVAASTDSASSDTSTDTKDGNKAVPGEVSTGVNGEDASTTTSDDETTPADTTTSPSSGDQTEKNTSEAGASDAGSSDSDSSSGSDE